ncbi:transmembrane protein 17-like [Ixodes scapularis]
MSSVRSLIEAVSETVFPGLHLTYSKWHGIAIRHGEELMTSLPLQMLIYFNLHYSPLWLISRILSLYIKYHRLSVMQQTISAAILAMMSLVEAPRLYLGYLGNLAEEVPALAGCWLLSLLFQLPLLAFLAIAGAMPLPLERAVDIPMGTLVLLQVVLGFGVIRQMTRKQTQRFLRHTGTTSERSGISNRSYVEEER